jgi:hypothetical protein
MAIYQKEARAEWLAKLPDAAVCFRAEVLLNQLDVLRGLRPKATPSEVNFSILSIRRARRITERSHRCHLIILRLGSSKPG